MTLRALYRRAAFLARAHLAADSRAHAIDIINARRLRIGSFVTAWTACGDRAGLVTRQRGYDAAIARDEARDRMLFDPYEERQAQRVAEQIGEIARRHDERRRKGLS